MSEINSSRGTIDAIYEALTRVNKRIKRADVLESSSLTDDLGLDSVRFVELTFALEEVFGLDAFPMDDWAASEMARTDKRFTIASLADRLAVLKRSYREHAQTRSQ